MKKAIELSLSDREGSGQLKRDNAVSQVRQMVEIQRAKITAMHDFLNAISSELDKLNQSLSELEKDPFAPEGLFFLSEDPALAMPNTSALSKKPKRFKARQNTKP